MIDPCRQLTRDTDNLFGESGKCFRRDTGVYSLLLMQIPASLCDLTSPLSQGNYLKRLIIAIDFEQNVLFSEHCDNFRKTFDARVAGVASGRFYLFSYPLRSPANVLNGKLPSKKVTYECSTDESCEAISCMYIFHDMVTIESCLEFILLRFEIKLVLSGSEVFRTETVQSCCGHLSVRALFARSGRSRGDGGELSIVQEEGFIRLDIRSVLEVSLGSSVE